MVWWRRNNREEDLEREVRADLELEAAEQAAGPLATGRVLVRTPSAGSI